MFGRESYGSRKLTIPLRLPDSTEHHCGLHFASQARRRIVPLLRLGDSILLLHRKDDEAPTSPGRSGSRPRLNIPRTMPIWRTSHPDLWHDETSHETLGRDTTQGR